MGVYWVGEEGVAHCGHGLVFCHVFGVGGFVIILKNLIGSIKY